MKKIIILATVAVLIIASIAAYLFYINNYTTNEEEVSQDFLLLREEVVQDLKVHKMNRRLLINEDQRPLLKKKEDFTTLSDYQNYVTPDNQVVVDYLSSNNIATAQDAYSTAVSWTWVSDSTLHGTAEKWIKPAEFIEDTPDPSKYPNNPVSAMASDCESQAYTLVSLLEAIGIAKTNVRVVVGEVDFSGNIGGHAWVQIYLNNEWIELEATSGPYWDDDEGKLVSSSGFGYNYFKNHPYPVLEYWAFFNDAFYYNPDTNLKSPDLPEHWLI